MLSFRMGYFYEDILLSVGEFGSWQVEKLIYLWILLFLSGARLILIGTDVNPHNFFCEDSSWNCSDIRKDWMLENKISRKEDLPAYKNIYPRLKNKGRSLHLLEADFSSYYYCQVFQPSRDEETGFCYWGNTTEEDSKYNCKSTDKYYFEGHNYYNDIHQRLNLLCRSPGEIAEHKAVDCVIYLLLLGIATFITKYVLTK